METKKILIIGAGISGLSLAINLKKMDIPFRIIEKQAKWEKKGLAMVIQGEGLSAASSLGILEEIKRHGNNRNLKRIENSNGKILKQFEPDPSDQSFIIKRDILHEALRSHIPETEMNTTISETQQTNSSIKIWFSDGSIDRFNLVVGADGINSKTRNIISKTELSAPLDSTVMDSGSVLWGITVNKKYSEIIEVWGKNGMCAFYPIPDGTVISFFRKEPATFQSSKPERADHIKEFFSHYSQPEIKEILNNLPENIYFDHVRYSRPTKWNKGRITLIGDACHSLSPLSGLGANLAMVEASQLAQLIKNSGPGKDMQRRLEEFNQNRKAEADKAFDLSKLRTQRSMLNIPKTWIRNIEMKQPDWKY